MPLGLSAALSSVESRESCDYGRVTSFLLRSRSVGVRGKNDQIQRVTVAESNSREMTQIPRRQPSDAESLSKRNDRAVKMADDGLLLDEAEPFSNLVERCADIAKRANSR